MAEPVRTSFKFAPPDPNRLSSMILPVLHVNTSPLNFRNDDNDNFLAQTS